MRPMLSMFIGEGVPLEVDDGTVG